MLLIVMIFMQGWRAACEHYGQCSETDTPAHWDSGQHSGPTLSAPGIIIIHHKLSIELHVLNTDFCVLTESCQGYEAAAGTDLRETVQSSPGGTH